MSVGESDSDLPGLLEYFEWERTEELFVLIGKGLLSVVVHKNYWFGSVRVRGLILAGYVG